jgi:imidazole glycerol-phosphate synthase subunit HisF
MNFIRELSDKFGSQNILVTVDIKKNWRCKYKIFSSYNSKLLSKPIDKLISEIVGLGVGEIVLNSVYNDGTFEGLDINLIEKITKLSPVLIIASGGVGSEKNFKLAVDAGANAVAAGSYFVFKGLRRAVLISYPKYEDLEDLFKKLNEIGVKI